MQDADLFLSLTQIAGVFVGFGALIAVRSGGTMTVCELDDVRWVMTTGIWVVIVALAPIIVGSYGVTGRELWLTCSLLALALLVVTMVVYARTPENRAELPMYLAMPWAKALLALGPTLWLPVALQVVTLALVIFGFFPNQEQALYLTAVALGLVMGALNLLVAVYWQRPSPTVDGRRLPADEGRNV